MSMILNPKRETMKEIIEADTDPMKEVLHLGQHLLPLPLNNGSICPLDDPNTNTFWYYDSRLPWSASDLCELPYIQNIF